MPPGTVTGPSNATMSTHTALSRSRISCRATSGAPVGPTSLQHATAALQYQQVVSRSRISCQAMSGGPVGPTSLQTAQQGGLAVQWMEVQ
jgi:hypothetical protein